MTGDYQGNSLGKGCVVVLTCNGGNDGGGAYRGVHSIQRLCEKITKNVIKKNANWFLLEEQHKGYRKLMVYDKNDN